MKTRLEIAIPGEGSRYHPIERQSVIGSGPGADVVLALPGLAAQHFRLELGARQLELRLAAGARPLRYEGKRFRGGKLAYGRDFYLDQVRFSCVAPGPAPRRRVLWLAPALVGAAALGGLALEHEHERGRSRTLAEPIELFAATAPCPEHDPAVALRRAQRLERAAHAKKERHRYDPHDGVEAGRLYQQARACFEAAGDDAGRERTDGAGAALRARVLEELRAARLRLRAALADQQSDLALAEIGALRRLMRNEPHHYARWLEEKERELRSTQAR
jgi:hypothetical protein